mgnify:CR=1 FL=1
MTCAGCCRFPSTMPEASAFLSLEDFFSASGPLARQLDAYAVRPLQLEMATTIYQALATRASLLCEAGTGTGKTCAYLVPALLSGRRVMIATGTKHLQDQL